MKNIFLLAAILLSNIAFGQNTPKPSFLENPNTLSTPNKFDPLEPQQGPSLFFSTTDQDRDINQKAGELFDLNQRFDSIYLWTLEPPLVPDWEYDHKYIGYRYDSKNNLTELTRQTWDGSAWINAFLHIFVYDVNNKLSISVHFKWNEISWNNYNRITNTFDPNNNLIREIIEYWNGFTWVITTQVLYTYDANSNHLSTTVQDLKLGKWVNSRQTVYTYNAGNNQTNQLNLIWTDSLWMNLSQYVFNYDTNNHLIGEEFQEWSGSAWVNKSKVVNTYDANQNLIYTLTIRWINNDWVNWKQYYYTYDKDHNQINRLAQLWDVDSWVSNFQWSNTYDTHDFMVSNTVKQFNNTGIEIIRSDSLHNYFHTVTSTKDMVDIDNNLNIYPNPSSGKFTISSSGSVGTIEIYDLAGKRVFASGIAKDNTSIEIDLSRYGNGVFIINQLDGMKVNSRKVIIQ